MKTKPMIQSLAIRLFSILCLYSPFSAFASDKINEEDALTVTVDITDTYCGGCNGAIDLTVVGGLPPYEYQWVDGFISEDRQNLCIGLYDVTISDASGCTATGSHFVGTNSFPDVILETQAEVDDYVFNNSFCTEVSGVLRIGTEFSSGPSNITDISGLSFITSVGSNLNIFQNHNLSSLNGLQNITSIGSSINITSNDGLTDLNGLPSVSTINGSLTIDNCAGLQSLEGLNSLTAVNGPRVYISNNTNIKNIYALNNLQTVNGDFDLRICLDLPSLDGLEALNFIGGDLILRDNFILNDITAFDHPINIGGSLTIQSTALSACSVEAICNMLENGAVSNLSNNNPGCNTEAEILSACNAIVLFPEVNIASCAGACDGSILAEVLEGGAPPFQYDWSTGATGPLIDSLCAGFYHLTITDSQNTMEELVIQVNEPDPLVATIIEFSDACFDNCDGKVDFAIAGGQAPYTIEGLTTGLCPGDYEVRITDSQGCTTVNNFTINTSELMNLTIDSIIDSDDFQDNGAIEITVTMGSPPFSFEWIRDGDLISTDEDPIDLMPGDYTLIITDGTGCSQDYDPLTVGGLVGLNDFEKDTRVNIFPIPAKEYIQIQFDASISNAVPYTVWNSTGALMQTGIFSQANLVQFAVNEFSAGVYFLKMDIGEEVLVRRFVVGR